MRIKDRIKKRYLVDTCLTAQYRATIHANSDLSIFLQKISSDTSGGVVQEPNDLQTIEII